VFGLLAGNTLWGEKEIQRERERERQKGEKNSG
jgi:hypothetical protein